MYAVCFSGVKIYCLCLYVRVRVGKLVHKCMITLAGFVIARVVIHCYTIGRCCYVRDTWVANTGGGGVRSVCMCPFLMRMYMIPREVIKVIATMCCFEKESLYALAQF